MRLSDLSAVHPDLSNRLRGCADEKISGRAQRAREFTGEIEGDPVRNPNFVGITGVRTMTRKASDLGPSCALILGVVMQLATTNTTSQNKAEGIDVLARSLFREMQREGYSSEHIIKFSSALLELLSADLVRRQAAE